MQVITAIWYDQYYHPFLTEVFNGAIDEAKIFSHYEEQKSLYNRTVIGAYPDTRVFSDGSRVILHLYEVIEEVEKSVYEANGIVDTEASPKELTDGRE